MKTVKRYSNRKLYDTETSKYTTVLELVKLPLGSFEIIDQDAKGNVNKDITTEVLLGSLSNNEVHVTTKVEVMKHCINKLAPLTV